MECFPVSIARHMKEFLSELVLFIGARNSQEIVIGCFGSHIFDAFLRISCMRSYAFKESAHRW